MDIKPTSVQSRKHSWETRLDSLNCPVDVINLRYLSARESVEIVVHREQEDAEKAAALEKRRQTIFSTLDILFK